MSSLQLPSCKTSNFLSDISSNKFLISPPLSSSFFGNDLCFSNGSSSSSSYYSSRVFHLKEGLSFSKRVAATKIFAMASDSSSFKMNLNEYMVKLERPLGIRFGASADGKIFVHAIKKGGNAEKSRIIMVGDSLKSGNIGPDGAFVVMKDYRDTQKMLKESEGSSSLVFERPYSPFPIQELIAMDDLDILFNRGRVPTATWNRNILPSDLQTSGENSGNSGFATFSLKSLTSQGWKYLKDQSGSVRSQTNISSPLSGQLVSVFSDEDSGESEWSHGSFPLEEYIKALDRSKGELIYNHSLGMQYSKITEDIYVGSCIQTETDVETLANHLGITAIINFQSPNECSNWGIDSNSINQSCQASNVLMINYPIREVDSYDLRKKLPFCTGLLLRLRRKHHRIYVTCTTGFDRSPACVIAFLHWLQDTSLPQAYKFVTDLHPSKPNRPAIVWATWDLIAMMENGKPHIGPPTHVVNFVWRGREGEGEEVCLVGDFTDNWKKPVQMGYNKSGSRFEVEVKLSHGRYCYKFVVNNEWKHSTLSPTVRDENGNLNNVIVVGDVASLRPSFEELQEDCASVKVIDRELEEMERVMLGRAAWCIAFNICPIRLAPK